MIYKSGSGLPDFFSFWLTELIAAGIEVVLPLEPNHYQRLRSLYQK